MFDEILLSWRLWKLERARSRIPEKYVALRKTSSDKDADAVAFDEHMHYREIDDEIEELQNTHLLQLARRYLLAIPKFDRDANWEQSEFTGKWHLKPEPLVNLRDAVRAEKKARREQWQGYVIWITAGAGLIGTLTGLISVINHGSK